MLVKPFGFLAPSADDSFLSFSPFALYDAFDTTNSVDSVAKTWSDTLNLGTGDSTFDTPFPVGNSALPDYNANGYWEIRNTGNNQGTGFRYSSDTNVTNDYSLITNGPHTLFTYVRKNGSFVNNGIDILGSGESSGAILLQNYQNETVAHAWASSLIIEFGTDTIADATWYIVGQRLDPGASTADLSTITCTVNGTVAITTEVGASYSAPTSVPYDIGVGGRGNAQRANMDITCYALYKKALSDSEIQTVCDELSDKYGEPT